jgi:putative Ca2+/H+ antiporter (TMEM165/GDT1 family)
MSDDPRDPFERIAPALASVLLAIVISLPLAALVGTAIGAEYRTRALVYLALVAWLVTGAVALFVATVQSAHGPVTPRRVLLWTASIWIWPLLLLRRRSR